MFMEGVQGDSDELDGSDNEKEVETDCFNS